MWRALRIALLSLILGLVSIGALLDRWRTTAWDRPLRVGLFPMAVDGRTATRHYVADLDESRFEPIEHFLEREARRWQLALDRPVDLTLHPPPREPPPARDSDAGTLSTVAWSLRLRWYNWRVGADSGEQIRLYLLYHDPAVTQAVPHSLGLQKGLVGVVYLYASDEFGDRNNVVVAHELLHTVGATDKYDPATNLPRFPDGYAHPDAEPLHPQRAAELMAGRRALGHDLAEMPASLQEVLIGEKSAREIGWLR